MKLKCTLQSVIHVIYALSAQNTRHSSFYTCMIMAFHPIKHGCQKLGVSILPVLWERGTKNSQGAYSWELCLLASLALLTCYYGAACPPPNFSQIATVGTTFLYLPPLLKFPLWLQGGDTTFSLIFLSKIWCRHILIPP